MIFRLSQVSQNIPEDELMLFHSLLYSELCGALYHFTVPLLRMSGNT